MEQRTHVMHPYPVNMIKNTCGWRVFTITPQAMDYDSRILVSKTTVRENFGSGLMNFISVYEYIVYPKQVTGEISFVIC